MLRRNCLLKHVVKGNVEGTRRGEEDVNSYWMSLRKKRRYCNLKREELDFTV
jgi:hypothetical protein